MRSGAFRARDGSRMAETAKRARFTTARPAVRRGRTKNHTKSK
jgi:hypothetical protein